MNLDLPENIYWRNACPEDADALLALIHSGAQALLTISTMQLKDVQAILQNPNFSTKESCLFFLRQPSQPLLLGFCWLLSSPFRLQQAEVWIQLHPHLEQHGITSQVIEAPLFSWLNWAAQQHFTPIISDHSFDPAFGCWLLGSSWQDDQDRCALFLRHGFYPLRFLLHMRRDLTPEQNSTLPQPPLPCTILPLYAKYNQEAYEIYKESFQEDRLFLPATFIAWEEEWVKKPNFLPDLSFALWVEDEMIGFILSEERSAANLRSVHINSLCVKPSWRGRGMATYLLAYALHVFMDYGFSHVTLDADPENPYNAVELYQKAAFTPLRMKVYFGKAVEVQQA